MSKDTFIKHSQVYHLNVPFFPFQLLNIWAYPKTPGFFEDLIVCCIKENPEPVLLKVSCHGVRPELELDKRAIQFDRVLLHRYVTISSKWT